MIDQVSGIYLGAMIFALLALPVLSDAGQEARCLALGVNCHCSEPLAATSYAKVGSPAQWVDPGDTTAGVDKVCTTQGPTGAALEFYDTVQTLVPVTSAQEAAAFAALPAGHSLVRVAKLASTCPNCEGGHFGPKLGSSSNFGRGRFALRWYIYHTPNFHFLSDGCNDKLADVWWPNQQSYGAFCAHDSFCSNLTALTGVDCCAKGPAANAEGGNEDTVDSARGVWMRHELIVTNRAGPNLNVIHYQKNITRGTPEIKRMDLSIRGNCWPYPACDWTPRNITPPAKVEWLYALLHRFNMGGGCTGYRLLTHMMAAGWDTDQGQRIGAAAEIEGAPGGLPTAPSGLNVQ